MNTSAWWVPPTWVSHQGKAEWWVSCGVSIPKKKQWLARITPTAQNWFKVCVSRLNYVSPVHLWYWGSFLLCFMPALQLQNMRWGNGQAEIDSLQPTLFFLFVCFNANKAYIYFPAWLYTVEIGDAGTCWKRLCQGRANQTVTRTMYSKWPRHIVVIKLWLPHVMQLWLTHVIQIHDAVGKFGRYKLYRPTLQVGRLHEQWEFSEDLRVWGFLCVLSGEPRFLIPQTGSLGERGISWDRKVCVGGCCKARSEVPTSAGFPAPHS